MAVESGPIVNLRCTRPGWHVLTLSVFSAGKLDGDFTYALMAKYVRREIRNLTDTERNTFLDTAQLIYATGQSEGERLYGDKYRSIETLIASHLRGAADISCDHWHDDAGIMTHHVAFTLEFEQSLQSVNPVVSVPYWDYTIDEYEYDDWTESPIFLDDWFGKASPANVEHIVSEGRWAYQAVSKDVGDSAPHNPYGLLRSPWNTNPTPYIMRHRYVLGEKDGGWVFPGCSDFQVAWEYSSLGRYFSNLNGFLHGPVHVMIGGQWWVNSSYDINITLGGNYLLASKYLWRQGYVRCPKLCADDTPAEHCVCSCPTELMQHFNDSRAFLEGTGLYNISNGMFDNYKKLRGFDCNHTTRCHDLAVKELCHVGHAGEMFTSAAPWDPTFWPIHGTAERYLMLKRIMARRNETELEDVWDYHHLGIDDGGSPSDTFHVCDWEGVTGMEMPNCTRGVCPGHHQFDLIPMSNFLGRNETYTNWEFWNLMDPFNDELPYTYDTFDHYPACTAQNKTWW